MIIKSNDTNDVRGKSLKLDEMTMVEKPFMQQLRELGWNDGDNEVIELSVQQKPSDSYRKSFKEVLIQEKFNKAIKRINPFLTDNQVSEIFSKIQGDETVNLIENNKSILDYLLNGYIIEQNEETGERDVPVSLIDYNNVDNNIFTAISEYTVAIPGTDHYIRPDIVLFVNGMPLVVVEAKSPKVANGIEEAIEQLERYKEQRGYSGEGVKKLFYCNQFTIVTNRIDALFGTITTNSKKYFYCWSDPFPMKLNELESGKSAPNKQTRLVAGMLAKRNLLDIVRSFTIFSENDEGHSIKIVARYQQFRAVNKTVQRLLNGKTPRERGGIIWHTQGSGKSLTMLFLVRAMRLHTKLASWKIVFITDRTKLQSQLAGTAKGVKMTIQQADFVNPKEPKDGKSLKELLSNNNSDLVMAMIQKFQEKGEISSFAGFHDLNKGENILVLTDEAHRSQYSLLAANLDDALPNATHVGFTGTPTEKTERKYLDYIDEYTMQQSIDDGVTLKIVYQGFTHSGTIQDKDSANAEFIDVFKDYTAKEWSEILHYESRDAYLKATETIKAKAKVMIDHYVENVFTGGFKAQVVGTGRLSAVRYKEALENALKEKIEELRKDNSSMQVDIDLLEKLEMAVIISGADRNDTPEEKQFNQKIYTQKNYQDTMISRFKQPFGATDEKTKQDGNVGILIVTDMLLTGFDAPIEQVMYLDKVIVSHNLLQAIARVNRSGPKGKECGFVVDFVGVGDHLKEALTKSDEKQTQVETGKIDEIINSLSNPKEEDKNLEEAHERIWDFFEENQLATKYDLTCFNDLDAIIDFFYDEDARGKYINLYSNFNKCFSIVLPRKEALKYTASWQVFTQIYEIIRVHFGEKKLSMIGIPHKLQPIADKYLKTLDIAEKVRPVLITSSEFLEKMVAPRKTLKSKATSTEHAIRQFVNFNIDDPFVAEDFSKIIDDIMQAFKENWEKIYEELEKVRQKIINLEKEETYGLQKKSQMPFFRKLKTELTANKDITEDKITNLVSLTQDLTQCIALETQSTDFWNSPIKRNKMESEIQRIILGYYDKFPCIGDKYRELTSLTMEIAETIGDVIKSELCK